MGYFEKDGQCQGRVMKMKTGGEINPWKISVVVPMYNAAATIERCATSLLCQTVGDAVEYIFVDDASTDGCVDVLKDVLRRYPNREVSIIKNSRNSGSACSREVGMNAARGEFAIHCDADDWIDPNLYEVMLSKAEQTGADVVCCPFALRCEDSSTAQVVNFKSAKLDLNDCPLDTLHFSLCNKLVRMSVIRDNNLHFFRGINCWEDLGLMSRVLVFVGSVEFVDGVYYYYRRAAGKSQTTSDMNRVLIDHLRLADCLCGWFDEKGLGQKYAPFLKFLKFTAKIKMLRGRNKDLLRWKATYPETNIGIMRYRHVPLPYRMAFYLANRLPEWLVSLILSSGKK